MSPFSSSLLTYKPKERMPSQARLKPRTQAVRILYELSQTDHPIDAVLDRHLSQPILNDVDDEGDPLPIKATQRVFIRTLVSAAIEHRHALDALISDLAPTITIDDMPLLQRAVLHVAIAEIRYSEQKGDTPVIINAAVEIARAYVGDSSARLVNGILGTVASRYSPPSPTR
jgi:N utilization substance protein B